MTIDASLGDSQVAAGLHTFDSLTASAPAPAWLHAGIVAAWRFDPAETTVTLITVSENATFLVQVGGTPVAVTRVARPGYMADASAFESEVAWVTALSGSGVLRVPQGVPTADGGYLATLTDPYGTRWSCVTYSYVTGSILEDIADPVPYFREIGRTTATLHDHALAWTPPAGFSRHSWDLADMVGPACRWGRWEDAALTSGELLMLDAAQRAALAVMADAPRTPDAWGLIHADLRPSNIMIAGDRLTVIDFDDCGYGWLMYDFAAALTFMEHVDDAATMAQEWVQGYAEVRPLTRTDEEIGCALSMIRRLQMLGWTTTHREDALPPALWRAQPEGTVAVAEKYLLSHTWLLD